MGHQVDIRRKRHRLAALKLGIAFRHLQLGIKAGFKEDQPRNDRGRWSGGRGSSSGNVRITRVDRTGDAKIDRTTDVLLDVAAEAVQAVGAGAGPLYGVAVHGAFAVSVKGLDLPGIGRHGVEESFSAGDLVRYGLDGSIRTDVVKRDGRSKSAPIIAVWDLKTGSTKLTSARVSEIRSNLGIDESVPVIELHVSKGVDVKSACAVLHV